MGCKGCGNKKSDSGKLAAPSQLFSRESLMRSAVDMNDNELVMIVYSHPNMGQHPVYGSGKNPRFYGYRSKGDKFLVLKSDQQAFPNYFQIAPDVPIIERKMQEPPPPPPKLVWGEEGAEVVDVEDYDDFDAPSPAAAEALAQESFTLQELPGVTPIIEKNLLARGLNTPQKLLESGVEGLQAVKYIGDTRARIIIAYLEDRYA